MLYYLIKNTMLFPEGRRMPSPSANLSLRVSMDQKGGYGFGSSSTHGLNFESLPLSRHVF